MAHEGVGLDPELEQLARERLGQPCVATRRRSRRARSARGRSAVGVKAVKSCVPTSAAAQRSSACASSRCGHHSARPSSNGCRTGGGQHPVAVGARAGVAAGVEAVGRGRGLEHGDRATAAPRSARLAEVVGGVAVELEARHLAPGVDARVGAAGDGQRHRRSPRIRSSAASSSPCTVRSPAARPSRRTAPRRRRSSSAVWSATLRPARGRPSRWSPSGGGRASRSACSRPGAPRSEARSPRTACGRRTCPGRARRAPAARVQVAALGERDQLLDLRLHRLGLRLAGLDPLVLDHLAAEVPQQRAAVRRVPAELVPRLAGGASLVSAAAYSSLSERPSASSASITSSVERLPKFGIAFSSDSERWIRSPTVWIPARFRQLYARTPISSSSIRRSSPSPVAAARSRARPRPAPSRLVSSSTRSASVKIARLLIRISGRLAKRRSRLHRAVRLDLERQLVEVGALADPRRVDRVRGAPDRREDRVDRDHAERLILGLVLLGRRVAAAAADGQIHLQLGPLLERGDRGRPG